MFQQLVPALRMTLFLTVLTGLVYPGVITGLCQVLFSQTSERQPDFTTGSSHRLKPDWPKLQQAGVLSSASVSCRQ